MDLKRLTCRALLAVVLLLIAETLNAADALARKVTQEFVASGLETIGSGSGIVIAPRLVLTNRHVAMDDEDQPRSGFGIRQAPEYKPGPKARVRWVSDQYDLAILEMNADLPVHKLLVLDGLPPLGTKVTAYGFPLGDVFGIGLTATGGQVTRHPATSAGSGASEDDPELRLIRDSLWHDARTSEGSSGGPLFSEQGVLVGLHFGSIIETHGMAVPSRAVSDFLRAAGAERGVGFVSVAEMANTKADYQPKDTTVFIDVMVRQGEVPADVATSEEEQELQRLRREIEAMIQRGLPRLTDDEFKVVRAGKVTPIFKPSPAAGIKAGEVVRLQGKLTIIEILDDGLLVLIDGILARIVITDFDPTEARARYADRIQTERSVDSVFLVGEPVDYRTRRGSTRSYFPLYVVSELLGRERMTKLVVAEDVRRRTAERARRDRQREQQAEMDAAARAAATKLLRRAFTDRTGKFTVDAVIVGLNGATRRSSCCAWQTRS